MEGRLEISPTGTIGFGKGRQAAEEWTLHIVQDIHYEIERVCVSESELECMETSVSFSSDPDPFRACCGHLRWKKSPENQLT